VTPYAPGGRRASGNLELYAWFFMRVSGLVLLLIAVFHLLYMHLVIKVDNMTFDVIAERWQNPFWRIFDLSLLVFAMAHGMNGLRTVIDDYVHRPAANTTIKWLAYVVAAILVLMGAQIIFTFPFTPPGS
jgi:succinate dehydrogenase / fumarate reductase membrane anchor subunit